MLILLYFESLGGWDDHAEREIKKISAALARQTGEEESETWKKIIGRISVILMKGNASLLSGRIPASPDSVFLKKALYKLILGFHTKKGRQKQS